MRELSYYLDLSLVPVSNKELPTGQRLTRLNIAEINPELLIQLRKVNLLATDPYIFYSCPGYRTPICHIDGDRGDFTEGWPSRAKLNYVIGDSNTLNTWYDVPAEKRANSVNSLTLVNQPYQFYSLKDSRPIKTETANPGWCLFESGVPHTVVNPTNNHKWTISFIMRDPITLRWITYQECKEQLLKLNLDLSK